LEGGSPDGASGGFWQVKSKASSLTHYFKNAIGNPAKIRTRYLLAVYQFNGDGSLLRSRLF
jgi:hypothetical protein